MPSTRFFHFLLFFLLLPLAAPARIWHVKADATGANTGLTWADAFPDLQDGLRAAEAGDEVWVARGVYAPTKTADRNISFVLKSGIGLYGVAAGRIRWRSGRGAFGQQDNAERKNRRWSKRLP